MKTIAFRFRVRSILSDRSVVEREMEQSRLLYNDLIAIERLRRTEVTAFWAERGGYADLIEALRVARESACALEKGPEQKAAFAVAEEIQQEVYAREALTVKQTKVAAETVDPALAMRKARSKELRAAAKDLGVELTPEQITVQLDKDPACCTKADLIRLECLAEAKRRGVAPSRKAIKSKQRAAGCVGPTEEIDAKARAAGVVAYKARGVTPGTRGFVAKAVEMAIEKSAPWPPRFKPRDLGSDSFGVSQVVAGHMHEIAQGTHSQVQILPVPDRVSKRGKMTQAGSRRSGRLALLRVRIGSEGPRRSPVWSDFEIIAHRPLPPDAVVRQLRITRERLGTQYQWHAVFTVQLPDESPLVAPTSEQRGVVAVDLGFRSELGDTRVGYWADDAGAFDPIYLPTRTWVPKPHGVRGARTDRVITPADRMKKESDIRAMLSRLFSSMQGQLVDWLSQNAAILPEWLAEDAKFVGRWRSHARLAQLAKEWRERRFEGDEAILAALVEWHKTWRHNFDWVENSARNAISARTEHYRRMAKRLATKYAVILVNDADFASARRRKTKEETAGLVMVEDRVRRQAQIAAPAELRAELKRAAARYGAILIKAKADSVTCHECGAACTYDRAASIKHTCEHCGAIWDQDFNAAKNMLRGYKDERLGDDKEPGSARKAGRPRKPNGKAVASSAAAE